MCLCCNIMVVSLWCHSESESDHLEHHELGGAPQKNYIVVRETCSWSMVNNEENWLWWQIKDWFNKKIKKFPKSAQSLGLVKFQVPSPERVKWHVEDDPYFDRKHAKIHTTLYFSNLLSSNSIWWVLPKHAISIFSKVLSVNPYIIGVEYCRTITKV